MTDTDTRPETPLEYLRRIKGTPEHKRLRAQARRQIKRMKERFRQSMQIAAE